MNYSILILFSIILPPVRPRDTSSKHGEKKKGMPLILFSFPLGGLWNWRRKKTPIIFKVCFINSELAADLVSHIEIKGHIVLGRALQIFTLGNASRDTDRTSDLELIRNPFCICRGVYE